MASAPTSRPWRSLILLFVVILGLSVWAFWPGESHMPKLGLDLQGGTQVTLVPKSATGDSAVTSDQLNQAVEIIRQRVNGLGVAEAEVTTQGTGDGAAIIVSMPGENKQGLEQQLSQTALLDFRPVDSEEATTTTATPSDATAGTPTSTPSPIVSATKKAKKGQSVELAKPKPTPTPSPTASPAPDPKTVHPPIQAAENNAFLQQAFAALDCSLPENHQGGTPDNPDQWLVTCSKDGSAKYLLEPAFIRGTQISDASAGLPQSGAGGWQVNLTFNAEGAKQLADVSTRLQPLSPPKNQFGIILDGLVVSSPYFSEPILGGQAQINGNFTSQQAQDLANVLKYGALPVNLQIAEVTTVSPTLGTDQLHAGLIAGGIGLILVMLYLLLYYRALGIVAMASLVVAAVVTFEIFVILGRTVGLALTLAGVAGAIVAIGITADSFIVYFERIRDDIRERKSLRVACETGWAKARNTLLAADFVSFLAAVILYFISVGNVRGFAFVLGLTTLIDVAVAFMFTRPIVALLARSNWFTRGGALTGISPERLGVAPSRELLLARAAKGQRKQEKQEAHAERKAEKKELAAVGAGASSSGLADEDEAPGLSDELGSGQLDATERAISDSEAGASGETDASANKKAGEDA